MTPHFEVHKTTKQMVHLTYVSDAPIRNGGLKRVRISTQPFSSYKKVFGVVLLIWGLKIRSYRISKHANEQSLHEPYFVFFYFDLNFQNRVGQNLTK